MYVKQKTVLSFLVRTKEKFGAMSPDDRGIPLSMWVRNVIEGCFHILSGSPTFDLHGWVGRVPRRRRLLDRKKTWTREGFRAIGELLTVTIEAVEADRRFRNPLFVGPLPITDGHVDRNRQAGRKLARARAQKSAKRESRREKEDKIVQKKLEWLLRQ